MVMTLLWTGREYYSLEHCMVTPTLTGFEISAAIVGYYEQKIYKVEYVIRTNQDWGTLYVDICFHLDNLVQRFQFFSDGEGNWISNGKAMDEFKGCREIDIPLTPFTNTLPIRRLQLVQGQKAEIQVIYCDLLENRIYPVRQQYTRLSNREYHYQNVPNDFEATVQVDQWGLVVDYPGLFVRTATVGALESKQSE
jgi:hypothetical protein